jgi:Restriction endonuclease
VDRTREVSRGKLRYCLQGNMLYVPERTELLEEDRRLCWMRVRVEDEYLSWLGTRDKTIGIDLVQLAMENVDIGLASLYSLRHEETAEGRRSVREFCSQTLFDELAKEPEVLLDVSKRDFERLTAEIFARRGFEVDLYRGSKDDGIDFVAIKSDEASPFILVAQCKHPDAANKNGKRNKVEVSVMRELFGAASIADVPNCVMITSSDYTAGAKKFAAKKPERIKLIDRQAVMRWVREYRWAAGE